MLLGLRSLLFLIISSCFFSCSTPIGPFTSSLRESAEIKDPEPSGYLQAFVSDTELFLHYNVAPSKKNRTLDSSYWAALPLSELDTNRFTSWEIFRTSECPHASLEELRKISIVDLSEDIDFQESAVALSKKVSEYVVENQLKPPVLLLNKKGVRNFILVGSQDSDGNCAFISTAPQGRVIDEEELSKNSWKYPIYATGDVVVGAIAVAGVAALYIFLEDRSRARKERRESKNCHFCHRNNCHKAH